MKIVARTTQGLKRVFGVKELNDNYQSVKDMAKGFYDYNAHKIERQGKTIYLPEVFLEKRQRDFRNLFILFAMIFVLGFYYLLYTLVHHLWMDALLMLSFCVFISALCFRYHFWWIQLKKHKLGCTFGEWKEETLKELSRRKGS